MTTIKILNRNSNATYDCNVPFIYKKDANETLDSGNVRITHLTSKIDIEAFDDVELDDSYSGKKYYLCVDTFSCTQEGLDNPTYTYDISLFSRTKKLEGRLCPNLSITSNNLNRSVWFYLNEYNDLYGEKIRVKHTNNTVTFDLKYPFASRVQTKFSAITCPERQWNTPTLREVLTDLMMVADCIPVIRNNKIDYMDLTEINVMDNAKKAHINYITESQSSEDYVSELQMDMQNSIQRDPSVDYQVISEKIHFDSDDSILTSDNIFIKTQFPIYEIKDIVMYVTQVKPITVDGVMKAQNLFREVNLTFLIKEYQEFMTLPVAKDQVNATLGQYQNSTLYYRRGGNRIENFGYLTPLWKELFSGPDTSLIDRLFVAYNLKSDYTSLLVYDGRNDFNPAQVWFDIKYVPQNEVFFRASKKDYPRNKRIVIDNQTNSYVNPFKQGMLEYFKANRLGNLQYQYNAVYRDEAITPSEIIDIFDSYEGNVVYEVQYQIYNDHMEVNALATKNYVLRDYYTGIKAKLRSWRIVDGSEAFTRNELVKTYCEFDLTAHQDIDMMPYIDFTNFLADAIANLQSSGKQIQYVTVSNAHIPGFMLLEMSKKLVGNSICYSFGFEDNFYAGKGVQAWDDTVKGCIFDYYTYTDSRGECAYLLYDLLYDIDDTSDGDLNLSGYVCERADRNEYIDKKAQEILGPRPIITNDSFTDYEVLYDSISFTKDNKEIPKINLQYEFMSVTNRVFFTEEFLKMLPLMRSRNYVAHIKIYKGPRDKFDPKNPTLSGGTEIGRLEFNEGAYVYTQNTGTSTILIGIDTDESTDNAFYIVNSNYFNPDNGIMFGIDGRKTCYLNLLKDRNKDIYDESGNIIDSI